MVQSKRNTNIPGGRGNWTMIFWDIFFPYFQQFKLWDTVYSDIVDFNPVRGGGSSHFVLSVLKVLIKLWNSLPFLLRNSHLSRFACAEKLGKGHGCLIYGVSRRRRRRHLLLESSRPFRPFRAISCHYWNGRGILYCALARLSQHFLC